MNIDVTKDEVIIDKNSDKAHENEYKITECHFTFDDFTNSFQVKRAIFTILSTGEKYEIDIINNKCDIPIEVLGHAYETVKLGVYGYNIEIVDEEETLKERFSPSYDTFVVPTGSYKEGALSPEPITPSQYDIYSSKLQEGLDDVAEALEEVSHVDIDAEQLEHGASVTITNRNNEPKTVVINDGYTPVKGVDYFTTSEIEEIENTVKTDVINELDFDNTISGIEQDIQNLNTNKASKTELEEEITARELADTNLQGQIDAISSSKDVVDIVGTYSDLQNYDTSTLTEEDVIKVLDDSTHNDAMSYYRWSNNTWNYIGSEGPFYTKSETDDRLNTKQAKIDSEHKLSSDLVDDTNQTHKFTSTNEKNTWNAKYDKPINGIPKSDLVASVQESLNKADTAIQDVSNKEDKSNKVTEINSSSTDTQYPSAKCVYDSQEEQNEQITELEMLYNAFPTVSAENETIQLDNTAKVKFREIDLKGNTSQVVIPEEQGTSVSNTSIYVSDVNTDKENTIEISGNTYQNSTTGKNLANFIDSQVYNYTNGVPSTISQTSVISNKTNNSYNIKYGTNSFLGVVSNTMEFEENTDYVFSFNRPYKSNFTQRIHILQVNNDDSYALLQAINAGVYETPYTYTYSNTTAKKVAFMISTNNSNPKDETETISEIMVRKSTTSDAYEPYTYGASPNPDYPQNIEVVTGENNITICGKNIFNEETEIGGWNFTEGEQLTKATTNHQLRCTNKIRVAPNTNYIFSVNGNAVTETVRFIFADKNNIILSSTTNSNGTILTPNNCEYLVFHSSAFKTTYGSTLPNPMIENGATITTYEAYQGTTYPINLGNIELCKIGTYQDRIYKQNDKWYLEKNINSYTFNGQENFDRLVRTGVIVFRYSGLTDIFKTQSQISILSNYLKGSIDSQGNLPNTIRSNNGQLVFMTIPDTNPISDSDTAFKSWLSTHNMVTKYILQTPITTEITDTTLVNQLNALYNATIYPITNINTDTSNLLPYIDLHYNFVTPSPSPSRPSVVNVVKGNNTITIANSDNTESQVFPINLRDMELCKINTYQDYIYESNGNWFKKGNINKVTFNGSENWTLQSINNYGIANFATNINNAIHLSYGRARTNYFITQSTTIGNTSTEGFFFNQENTFYIRINSNKASTVTELKSWLSTHNTIVYYVLETPTDTQITDTTLITQLNNIKKAYSYDTQTNITQINADKPFIINAEAIMSLKNIFNS